MADPQLSLALADRHAGQAANLAAGTTGHRDDRSTVELAVAILARNPKPFTADDVHELVEHELKRGYVRNLVSSVMGRWAQDGRIVEQTGIRPVASGHRTRRASRNRWWMGGQCR